jgi:hypothetical protein
MCVLVFCTILSETFLILRIYERDTIQNVNWSSCKVPVIIVRFQGKLYFLNRSSKITKISKPMKIRPVGAELLHADG